MIFAKTGTLVSFDAKYRAYVLFFSESAHLFHAPFFIHILISTQCSVQRQTTRIASGLSDCNRLIGVFWLVIRVNAYIPPMIELGKEVFHHRMIDGFQNLIAL